MRANPKGDWQIKDVEKLCDEHGLTCKSPSRGDHYVVSSACVAYNQSVPAWKPIKPFYIKKVVALADCHIEAMRKMQEKTSKRRKPLANTGS